MRNLPRAVIAVALAAGLSWTPARDAAALMDEGRPACDYCRMIMTERRFGGMLETAEGRGLIFDSAECLAAYCLRNEAASATSHAMWSVCWAPPGVWMRAERAWYLHSDRLESPMAMNLSAFQSRSDAERASRAHPGEVLSWRQVLALVDRTWFHQDTGR